MKTLYRILLAIFCAAAFTACSLDEESTSAVSTPENFFRSYQECQSVVNGCYIPLKSIYVYNYFLATECVSDVIWCASGTLDAQLDISPVQRGFQTHGKSNRNASGEAMTYGCPVDSGL